MALGASRYYLWRWETARIVGPASPTIPRAPDEPSNEAKHVIVSGMTERKRHRNLTQSTFAHVLNVRNALFFPGD